MTRLKALLALGALLLLPATSLAGEEDTAWRAGDLIYYRFGCEDAEAMTHIAASAARLKAVLEVAPRCFRASAPLAARLEAWIAGPFTDVQGSVGSVWRIEDQQGETAYILLRDDTGPNPREQLL